MSKQPVKEIQVEVEQRPGVVRRIWVSVQPPRTITIQTAAAYTLVALICGVGGLADPSPNALHGMGQAVTTWVSVLYLAGGCLGAVSAWKGWWGAERAALFFVAGAAALRAVNAAWLIYGVGVHGQSTYFGEILAFLLMLKIRWDRIQGAQIDPSR